MTTGKSAFCARRVFAVLLLAVAAGTAQAQCITDLSGKMICPPPESSCMKDRYGSVVCATPKGGITIDRYGEPVCGPGACIRNLQGDMVCSSSPGGSAAMDLHAQAVCTDGCTPATAAQCVRPK
jgi:hypothetical protein